MLFGLKGLNYTVSITPSPWAEVTGYAQGHKVMEEATPGIELSSEFSFSFSSSFFFFLNILILLNATSCRMGGKAVGDSVKPLLITERRKTPQKISHFEDSTFEKKKKNNNYK